MSRWSQKIVAVTGGSAGLGLAIAQRFAARGARLALLARDRERLKAAASNFSPADVAAISADVTDTEQARSAIAQVLERFGRLDVLVNNVGKSVRMELFETTLSDYRDFMNINLHAAVNCTRAAIDALRESSGHVVNIGSLSCKTAWPFLAPYTTSKFALAAFNHHLRLEGPSNVHYMLVCPGPIKRDDEGDRYDHQTAGMPEFARKPAAGAKVRGVDPDVLADKIIEGCEKRKLELMPFRARLIYVALSCSPGFGDWLIQRTMKR